MSKGSCLQPTHDERCYEHVKRSSRRYLERLEISNTVIPELFGAIIQLGDDLRIVLAIVQR